MDALSELIKGIQKTSEETTELIESLIIGIAFREMIQEDETSPIYDN